MVDKGDAFLGLWVLQVGCTVITSPRDPGEESFQKQGGSWQGRKTSRSAGVAMLSSHLKQNMNSNISSANRRGTPETVCTGSFIPFCLLFLMFFLAMTLNVVALVAFVAFHKIRLTVHSGLGTVKKVIN